MRTPCKGPDIRIRINGSLTTGPISATMGLPRLSGNRAEFGTPLHPRSVSKQAEEIRG